MCSLLLTSIASLIFAMTYNQVFQIKSKEKIKRKLNFKENYLFEKLFGFDGRSLIYIKLTTISPSPPPSLHFKRSLDAPEIFPGNVSIQAVHDPQNSADVLRIETIINAMHFMFIFITHINTNHSRKCSTRGRRKELGVKENVR